MFRLREIAREDLPKINGWRNDFDLVSLLVSPYRYVCKEIDERWYDCYLLNRQGNIRCAIVTKEEDSILGLVSLINIDFIFRSADFHLMIGDSDNRGKGIGFFATKEILLHAFQNLNLNRVQLELLNSNLHARKLYEKVGFKVEGIRRKAVFKQGDYMDVIVMSILKNEFEY